MSHQEPQENKTEDTLRRTRDWIAQKADSAHARVWLAIFSFTESSIFFIPPDPLLAAMVFVHKARWIQYTIITSIASVAGAVFGYIVGAVLFDALGMPIIELYNLHERVALASELINESVFVFTLTAAFTPIPFKVAVLAAGFTKANFISFFVATIIGRGARYFLVGVVAKVFGDNADAIMKRFWFFATVVGIVVLVLYGVYFVLW
jgi:membrane protein YqaA with SNARE-associated domain